MTESAGPASQRASPRELVAVALGLIALAGIQLTAIDGWYLFTRYFWVDELYTRAVVADPSFGHAFAAIRGGMDSMPTYQLLLRVLALAVPDPAEAFLRGAAFASVMLALIGVYALLRRSVAPAAAFAGVLAIWAHPIALTYAFDARFYGPFLAAAIWFCWFVDRRLDGPATRASAIALALASLLLCGIHVFGVIVWGVALVTAALAYRSWRPLLPAAIGPIMVPILWVVALAPQRATITIPTWEAGFTWEKALNTSADLLLPEYLATVFLVIFAVLCAQRLLRPAAAAGVAALPGRSLVLLASLCLIVPAVVVVSLVMQPTLTPRYFIPAIAAIAAPIAYALSRAPRWGAAVVAGILLLVGTNDLRWTAVRARNQDEKTRAVAAAIRQVPAGQRVLFEVTHVQSVVWRYAPDLRDRIAWLDFSTGQVPHPSPIRIVSRDLARAFARFYDGMPSVSWDAIQTSPEFYVVPDARAWNPGAPAATADTRYPGFVLTPVNEHVMRATRR